MLSSRLKKSRNSRSKKGFLLNIAGNEISQITRTTYQNCGKLFSKLPWEQTEWNLVCRGLEKYLR